MGRSRRLPSSPSSPSRNTMVRNPSHLGSKLQDPSGRSETGLASIGATGGITGRSMPLVSGRQVSPTAIYAGGAGARRLEQCHGKRPPLPQRQAMGLRVEYLETDVIRPRIRMVLHSFANRFHITPRDERVDETVAALPHEVVVGEAGAAPVVGGVRQVEVSGNVPTGNRPGLVGVCLQDDRLLWQEPAVRPESAASLRRMLRRDEIGVGA